VDLDSVDSGHVDSGKTLESPEGFRLFVRAKVFFGFCSQFSVCMRTGRSISSDRDVDGLVWPQGSPQVIISVDSRGTSGLRIAPVGGINRTISDSSECITLQRGTLPSTPLGAESRSVG
jgi:hypothetical protein